MNKSHISIDDYDVAASPPPRAVVILLGWWGAQMKHVQKYSALYQERNCVTVTGIVESKAILTLDIYALEAFAQKLASQTATVVREMEQAPNNGGKKIPVMIHSFSNGGAYPLWRLEVLIERAMMEKNVAEIQKTQDLLLIGDRLRGEIFDSAPCFPDNNSAMKAMKHSISNTILRNIFRVTLLIHVFLVLVHRILFNKSDSRMDFWKHMTESRLCLNQAYVYSTMDDITDVKMLEELVSARQGHAHAHILVKKFDDSEHVQHYRKYQSEYCELMDTFLDRIQEKS
jgi:hypothetical protein